jgi:Right handed beta helix region
LTVTAPALAQPPVDGAEVNVVPAPMQPPVDGAEVNIASVPEQPQADTATVNVATEVLAAVLSPLVAPGPEVPVESPLAWALLAWARRQVQDLSSDLGVPTLPQPVETSEPIDDAGVRPTALGAVDAPPAAVNGAITVPDNSPSTLMAAPLVGNDTEPAGDTLTGAADLSAKDTATVSPAIDSLIDRTDFLQDQFDALRPGDTLILDSGTFDYRRSLYIRTSNVSIIGNDTTLHATNPASAALIIQASNVTVSNLNLTAPISRRRVDSSYRTRLVFGGSGVHISDVTITGGTSAGIYITGARNFVLERVTVQDTAADGVQINNGSNNGILNDVTTLRTGDDGIAIVSYQLPLLGTVHDITVNNPVVNGSGQRGLVVVGGERITFNNIDVSNTALSGVFVGTQGLFFIRDTDTVHVNGGTVTQCGIGGIPSGAVLIWSANRNQSVSNVLIENLTIRDTPFSAFTNVGIWADVVLGEPVSNIAFRNIAIEQPLPVYPLPFFAVGAAQSSYTATDFTVNGRPVTITPPIPPLFSEFLLNVNRVLAWFSFGSWNISGFAKPPINAGDRFAVEGPLML